MSGSRLCSRELFLGGLVLSILALASITASASPLPLSGGGVLQTSNLVGTLAGFSNTCINWNASLACSASTAVQDSVSGSDPALFSVGSFEDTIRDLPSGTSTLVDFETVLGPLGLVHFDLTSIVIPGAGGNCTTFALFATCTPAGSPFTLTQSSSNQLSLSFSITEIAYLGTSATGSTAYDGVFSTQFSGNLPNGQAYTIPNFLAYIAGGGTVTSTWSSTQSPHSTTIPGTPEPSSFTLLLTPALASIALFRRKLQRA